MNYAAFHIVLVCALLGGPLLAVVGCVIALCRKSHDVYKDAAAQRRSDEAFEFLKRELAFKWMWFFAAAMAVLDISYFIYFGHSSSNRWVVGSVLGVWVLGPPLYFLFEWKIYPGPYEGPWLERHKMGQDVATKLWAAVVVILVGLSKDW